MAFDPGDDRLPFLRSDPLTVVFAVLSALQKEIRALGDGLAAAFDLKGLFADVAADHAVDAGHFFEDARAFLLDGWGAHRGERMSVFFTLYITSPIISSKVQQNSHS